MGTTRGSWQRPPTADTARCACARTHTFTTHALALHSFSLRVCVFISLCLCVCVCAYVSVYICVGVYVYVYKLVCVRPFGRILSSEAERDRGLYLYAPERVTHTYPHKLSHLNTHHGTNAYEHITHAHISTFTLSHPNTFVSDRRMSCWGLGRSRRCTRASTRRRPAPSRGTSSGYA